MSKTAFLFPGQGAQFAGMGKTLAEAYPEAARVFEEADLALGFPISKLCFEGPEDQLKLTENTQPALLTVSIAAHAVLKSKGVAADYVAGHSLGEYSALVAAGSLDFADAVRLVRQRGRFMQEAVPAGVGAMAALLKLPGEALAGVLEQAAQGEVVTAANFNTPDQVVIAGHGGAVGRAMDLARAAGAKRAIPLQVSAPFHCPLMKPAQERMKELLEKTAFRDLAVPLINNWQAQEIHTGAEAREGLYHQIPNPVRWSETILLLASKGVTRFIEVGAGGVLSGLVRNIDASAMVSKFGSRPQINTNKRRSASAFICGYFFFDFELTRVAEKFYELGCVHGIEFGADSVADVEDGALAVGEQAGFLCSGAGDHAGCAAAAAALGLGRSGFAMGDQFRGLLFFRGQLDVAVSDHRSGVGVQTSDVGGAAGVDEHPDHFFDGRDGLGVAFG